MKKSILKIALSALLVAVVLVGGTLAYLVTATDMLTNTFAVVDIDTEVKEPDPSTGAEKAPYVVNNSNVPVYVRAYAVVSSEGTVPVSADDVKINFPTDDDADWVKIGDYYYYTEAVPVAGEGVENWTTPLFTGVDVINEALKTNADAKFSVYVYHESVQADPDNLTTAADIAKLFENA